MSRASVVPRQVAVPDATDFWRQFGSIAVPPPDFDRDSQLLTTHCRELCTADFPAIVKSLQEVSDTFGFESPLTPPFSVNPTGNESFVKFPISICRCGECEMREDNDFYHGVCGPATLTKRPYSYVHVNLSRKLASAELLQMLLRPLFKSENIRLRMVPGDSGGSAVFLARDAQEEKQIRRVLRSPPVRIEKGIRIFHVDTIDVLSWS